MRAKEFVAWLSSPEGVLTTRHAAEMLRNADPEIDDLDLVQRVADMGFPLWAARSLFIRSCDRFPPAICQKCSGRFMIKKKSAVGRAVCPKCTSRPKTAEELRQAKARSITNQAIRSGKLRRKPCEVCGAENSEVHHPDYSRPLFIKWLCYGCHLDEHQNLRNARN